MAYTWQDGELVTAAKLNNYGSGLEAIKQDCEDAVDDCESAQTRCEAATVHQPIVQSGTWWTWNQNTSAYVDTGEPVTGQTTAVVTYQEGTSGTVAPTGSWSSTVPTVAQGNYLWTKTVFNELYTTYSVARQGVDGTGAVISVNGASGVVVLDTDDISDSGCTNKWATQQIITDSHNHNNKNLLDAITVAPATTTTYTGTLTTTWTSQSGYVTQNVTVNGILATDNPIVDIVATTSGYDTEQTEWAKVFKAECSADTITFYANESTTTELTLSVKVVR